MQPAFILLGLLHAATTWVGPQTGQGSRVHMVRVAGCLHPQQLCAGQVPLSQLFTYSQRAHHPTDSAGGLGHELDRGGLNTGVACGLRRTCVTI